EPSLLTSPHPASNVLLSTPRPSVEISPMAYLYTQHSAVRGGRRLVSRLLRSCGMDSNVDRLAELARQFPMTYHVLAEWGADARWNQQRIGFQVELHGEVIEKDGGEVAAQEALREVADWAFGHGDADVSLSIDAQRGHLVREPSADGWVAEVVGHVV